MWIPSARRGSQESHRMELKGRVVLVVLLAGLGVSLCRGQVISGAQLISRRLRETTGQVSASRFICPLPVRSCCPRLIITFWGSRLPAAVSAGEPASQLLLKARSKTYGRASHEPERRFMKHPDLAFGNCCTSGQMCMLARCP